MTAPSYHAPLSATQRTAVISWLESQGISSADILKHLQTEPVTGNKATTLDVYINAGHAVWAMELDYTLLEYEVQVKEHGQLPPLTPSGLGAITPVPGDVLSRALGAIGLPGGIVQIGEILVGLIIVGVAVSAMMKGRR